MKKVHLCLISSKYCAEDVLLGLKTKILSYFVALFTIVFFIFAMIIIKIIWSALYDRIALIHETK